MQSDKTHDQQMRIIEKRENTANGDKDLDITADLKRLGAAREAFRKGEDLQFRDADNDGDRDIARGVNQESIHRKGSGHT